MQEECSRLKAQVEEVEVTMKETLELVNKLQADLGEANTLRLASESRAKATKDLVVILKCQV